MWLQTEAEKAEVASLLDALLDIQRQKRAQEKAQRLLAHVQSTQSLARQACDRIEVGRFNGVAGTMEDIWGRTSDARYDAEDSPSSSSSRPLSLATVVTITTCSTSASVVCCPAEEASLHGKNQACTNFEYEPVLHLPHTKSFPSSSDLSLPGILFRGSARLETSSKPSAGKVSWGNRVGRKIRAYGRQIMGQA